MIYVELDAEGIRQEFYAYGRGESFSSEGYHALYDILDEFGEDYRLDVIEVCGWFTEYGASDLVKNYGYELTDEDYVDDYGDKLDDEELAELIADKLEYDREVHRFSTWDGKTRYIIGS